jgi:hypothetical protein
VKFVFTTGHKNYEGIVFKSAACLAARRLSRIFDKALLALTNRLAAEEVGKT